VHHLRSLPVWHTVVPSDLGELTLVRDEGFDKTARQLTEYLAAERRVVGRDGKLTGYAGGIGRKRHLLELERERVCSAERIPYQDALISGL